MLKPNTVTPPSRDSSSAELRYTAHQTSTGIDSFTFKAFDGVKYSDLATIIINIKQPPQKITNINAPTVTPSSAKITWDSPTSTEPILFYEIQRAASPYVSIANVTGSTTEYDDNTVVSGEQYDYKIRSFIEREIYGEFSTPIQVSVPVSDATPPRIDSISRLEPLDESTDSSALKFRVTFDESVTGVDQSDFKTGGTAASSVTGFVANSAVQYDVDVSVTTGGTVSLNLISLGHGIVDTDFVPNALTDTAPKSITQTYIVALDTTVPGMPTDVTATLVSTLRIAPYWPPPSDEGDSLITGYLIERSIDDKEFLTIVSDTASRYFLYVDEVRDSTAVSYRVSAINDVGVSLPSEASEQTSTLSKNEPPLIQLIDGNREVDAQTLLSFSVYVIDRDYDPLIYSLGSNAPQGAEIGRTTGEFTWTPTQSQVGTHTFDAIVSDGKDTDSKTITVIVNDAKAVP